MGNVALGITTDAADQKVPVASVSSNTINTLRKHGLCAGDAVSFSGDHVDDTDLDQASIMYVIASGLTDTAFKVSTTVGGAAATLTNKSPAAGERDIDVTVNPLAYVLPGTQLNGSITSGATTITVANSALLPAAPFVAIISDTQDEVVLVTANPQGTPDHVLTVVRGFEGSLAGAHGDNKKVRARSLAPSACAMADFDALEALIRAECGKTTNDQHNSRSFGNTLRRFVTSTTAGVTTVTTKTSGGADTAHGMVQGDRFVIVARPSDATQSGQGENVRLGHTYYVKSAETNTFTFCAERLHSSENPYHGSATETAAVDVGTDFTGSPSYAFLRVLTTGGGTIRTLGVKNSLYPRIWGWGSNVGTIRERPLTATLHFRAVTDRAAQSMVNHTTTCSSEDDASIKHTYQEIRFGGTTSGTFKISVRTGVSTVVESDAITYSSTDSHLAALIEEALSTSAFSALSNLRTEHRPREGGDVVIAVSFHGALRALTVSQAAPLTANGTIVVKNQNHLLIPSQRSNVLERWARLGEQIALASPAKVFFRMNFEFEKKYFAWTSKPADRVWVEAKTVNGKTTPGHWKNASPGQQQAWDAWGDDASDPRNPQQPWVNQWQDMVTAIETTGGASNVRFVWCPADGTPSAPLMSSWPGDANVDFTGWDYYLAYPPVSLARSTSPLVTTKETHGFNAGDEIKFIALSGGAGLSVNKRYFVLASGLTTTAFKVATTAGGDAVTFSAIRSGKVSTWKSPKHDAHDRLVLNARGLRQVASKQIIVCEFGFGAKASTKVRRRSRQYLVDPDDTTLFEYAPDAGSDGLSEENMTAAATAGPARPIRFREWLDLVCRLGAPVSYVVAAIYWDRDLGGDADWRLESDTSLIRDFAKAIVGKDTRTAI